MFFLQVNKPAPLPVWMNTFQPLNVKVWLFVLATLVLCVVFIHTSSKFCESMNCGHLILIALPLGHDGEKSEKRWSNGLRIFLLLYVLAMVVVTTAYKGALLSSLAIPHIHEPIGKIFSRFIVLKTWH